MNRVISDDFIDLFLEFVHFPGCSIRICRNGFFQGHSSEKPEFGQYVIGVFDQLGPLLDQKMGAGALEGINAARHGEYIAALVQGRRCGNQGTAVPGGLHNDRPPAQSADDPVADGEIFGLRGGPCRELRHNGAVFLYPPEQCPVGLGIHHINARPQNPYGKTISHQTPAVSGGVDPSCQAADYTYAPSCQTQGDFFRRLSAVVGRVPRPHNADQCFLERDLFPPDIQYHRRIVDLSQECRVRGVGVDENPGITLFRLPYFTFGLRVKCPVRNFSGNIPAHPLYMHQFCSVRREDRFRIAECFDQPLEDSVPQARNHIEGQPGQPIVLRRDHGLQLGTPCVAGFSKFEVTSLKCLKLEKENSDLNF